MDFPIENGGSFHSYVDVYQRVTSPSWNAVRPLSCGTTCFHCQGGGWTDRRGLGRRVEWVGFFDGGLGFNPQDEKSSNYGSTLAVQIQYIQYDSIISNFVVT